jgi:hypothetical protein
MRFLSIFRLPQHSRYNYIPRYYDADKEALEERLKEIKMLQEDTPEAMKKRIASGLRYGMGDATYRKKTVRRSNFIVLITVLLLISLSLFFIRYYLAEFMESI